MGGVGCLVCPDDPLFPALVGPDVAVGGDVRAVVGGEAWDGGEGLLPVRLRVSESQIHQCPFKSFKVSF